MKVNKTYEEINEKIKSESAVVVTAEEMIKIVEEHGAEKAAKDIDVVTTGTFGCMCSSGAFLNFGHSDPPIKPETVYLNDVKAYHGNAAADVYLGATQMASPRNFQYGGGHVLEDFLKGQEIQMRASAYGTDCYPRTELKASITLDDLNQAILTNPRNCYQHYNCAVNTSKKTIYTYMGKLLPNLGNATYGGAGELSPLNNDPNYETIGVGTRMFLAGGEGMVISEGTQHEPKSDFGTLMVMGDMKNMSPEYLAGASIEGYGTSCYIGLGIPIPILNERIAKNCAVKNKDILTNVVDYSTGTRSRPTIKQVSYNDLKSGEIEINGKGVKVSSTTSMYKARKIAEELKDWVANKGFMLYKPVRKLSTSMEFHPLPDSSKATLVRSLMKHAITVHEDSDLKDVAKKFLEKNENHIVVVDEDHKLRGFLTTFDVAKAVAGNGDSLKEVMIPKRKVHTIQQSCPIDVAVRTMKKFKISSLPVLDKEEKVVGLISAEELMKEEQNTEVEK